MKTSEQFCLIHNILKSTFLGVPVIQFFRMLMIKKNYQYLNIIIPMLQDKENVQLRAEKQLVITIKA